MELRISLHKTILFIILHLLGNTSTLTAQSSNLANNSVTITITTTTEPPIITTDNETLLSGNEFVDFTETPTLLYDNLSNDNSSVANKTLDSNSSTTGLQNDNLTALKIEHDNASELNDSDAEEDAAEPEEEVDKASAHPFEPPQNVSQYMDYIERLFHDLRHQITSFFEPHIPQLIRTSQMVQLSSSCSYDMLRMALALRQFAPWALRMIDSSGKVPEGLFEGSFTALGSYDECIDTVFASPSPNAQQTPMQPLASPSSAPAGGAPQSSESGAVTPTQGKYCLVHILPFMPPKPPADKVESMFREEANKRNYTKDDQFSRLSPMFYYMKFRIGVCLPSTCADSDMNSISSALSSSLRLNITIPYCKVKQSQPLTMHQMVGGFIFAVVLALVVAATFVDCFRGQLARILSMKKETTSSEPSKFAIKLTIEDLTHATKAPVMTLHNHHDMSCDTLSSCSQDSTNTPSLHERLKKHWQWLPFSILTNFRLFFAPNLAPKLQRSSNAQPQHHLTTIRCLDGIRVLSLCWVIIANSYITLDPRATKRLTKTREAPKDLLFQVIVQASLAIETFFFLSGLLVSLSYARTLHQDASIVQRKSSDKQSAAYKAIRWIQFYVHRYVRLTPATMLVIAFTMFAFRFGDGPLWSEATQKAHNSCNENWWRHMLHVANFIDTRQMCFIHYWYIAADMQLFLFAPFIMLLVYNYRKLSYLLVSSVAAASVAFVFYTTYMRNLPPTLLFYSSDPDTRREFGNTVMTKPLTHALPYLVGLLLGKWLHDRCTEEPKQNASRGIARHLLSSKLFGSLAVLIFAVEIFIPYSWNNSHLPTKFVSSLYASTFRFGWSLALAFVVISCRHRRTKMCNRSSRELSLSLANSSESLCGGGGSLQRRARKQSQCSTCDSSLKTMSTTSLNYDELSSTTTVSSANDQMDTRARATCAGGAQSQAYCFCATGGNIVNRVLALDIFRHLSKLSFVAYLIHLPLMSVFVAQTRGLFAFSHTLVIHLALSYLVMTFVLSFILVHIIEFPFITLERYVFERIIAACCTKNDDTDTELSHTGTLPSQRLAQNKLAPQLDQQLGAASQRVNQRDHQISVRL